MAEQKITTTAKTLDDVLNFLRKARTAHSAGEIDHVPTVEVIVNVTAALSRDFNGELR